MDIFEVLKKEHEKVKKIFSQIEEMEEDAEDGYEELFAGLKSELLSHAEAEQKTFYEPLKGREGMEEILAEAEEEHELVKKLLEEMEKEEVGDDTWLEKCSMLKENVEGHVEEEEGELFRQAREVVTNEEAIDMAKKFQEAKEGYVAS